VFISGLALPIRGSLSLHIECRGGTISKGLIFGFDLGGCL